MIEILIVAKRNALEAPWMPECPDKTPIVWGRPKYWLLGVDVDFIIPIYLGIFDDLQEAERRQKELLFDINKPNFLRKDLTFTPDNGIIDIEEDSGSEH
jgi:hypothetical protein